MTTTPMQPPSGGARPTPPLDPPDVALRDVPLATGVRLRCAERGDPVGEPVILLHGYSDSWRSFAALMPLLPRALRVLAPDQRGHGDSERPADGYALPDLAADVVALMDAHDIARATVVGHSMGSLVAQHVALRAPERVERLVLVGSATAARNVAGMDELAAAVHAFEAPDEPAPAAFVREFQESTIHAAVDPAFVDAMVAASLKLPARVWQALADAMLAAPVPTGLAALDLPTLLLWGERDAYFPRSEQDALLRLLRRARLVTYPDTGHAPHWERPDLVAGDVAAFAAGGR